MKKKLYRTVIILISLFLVTILYLSIVGIKTKKFNSQIISQIKNIKPDIELKINEVSAKLNLFNFSINAKTIGTSLIFKNKIIEIEYIKSKISLKSLIKNKFALSEISISTKSLPVKGLINFIRLFNNNPKLFIVEQFINKGYVIADLKLEFDDLGKIRDNFNIKGLVRDGQISLLNKNKLSDIDFNFQITNKKYQINDIELLLNNKRIYIPKFKALNQDNMILVSGNLYNKKTKFKKQYINNLINSEILKGNFREIEFSSESDFKFKIDNNFKFKDFFVKSSINLDFLEIKNFLELKNFFPKIKDHFVFKNQKIQLEYDAGNLSVVGSGDIYLQDKIDEIQYEFKKDKKKYIFESNLKILDNSFLIDLLNYHKDESSTLKLSFKGNISEKNIFFDNILILENENKFNIEELELSDKYKINSIKQVLISFKDRDNLDNNIKIIKKGKDYKIFGKSLNLNNIIKKILNSDDNKKSDFFNKNLSLLIDIDKIYLDKNNIANNLEGSLFLNNNKITKLNLISIFENQDKIKFTIRTNKDEKITTIFSDYAKPLVERYKFIKGFNEGTLDFYSIKKNDETKSSLKIYDFKLKELPVLTKILTLASLQGIADLLTGEGIRFNEFEMNFTNKDKLMTIDEIYAIGPAISILMEGYIEQDDLISLRGTLVPATTINKTISAIPLIGDILVGKKTGEGVFGVSFKIKGPPKNLETTVNPIKTLTPRFITRTLEKIKKN